MGVVEAVGQSPMSLALVVLTVAMAVGREVAIASRNPTAMRWARALFRPFLGLVAVFAIVVAARIVLILD